MKKTKRVTKLVIIMCLLISMMSITVHATSGVISFTDPTTEAGVEFTVDMAIKSDSTAVGSATIAMTYDTEKLQFVSGDGVTASGSTLTYTVTGDGSSTKLLTTMTFLALKQGEAKITINSVDATDASGNTLSCSEGNSTITISGGTEVEATTTNDTASTDSTENTDSADSTSMESSGLTVDSVTYTISETLSNSDQVEGYTESTIEYDGVTYPVLVGDTSGITLAKLVSPDGVEAMYCYDSSTDTFWPYVQMKISDSTYIVLIRDEFEETLPDNYQLTSLTVNGYIFPTWQDTENSGYYLLNAINSLGEQEAYQFDSQDETYQRYIIPEIVVEEEATGFLAKLTEYLEDFLLLALIVLGVVAFFVLLIIIIMAAKLRNRNKELDDLYDEYVNSDYKPAPVAKKTPTTGKRAIPASSTKLLKEVYPDDEFDDEFDDDFDDEFDDEFDDDFDDEYEDDFDDDYDDDYDDDFDDDFNIDDFEELRIPDNSIRNRGSRRNDGIDFIDL